MIPMLTAERARELLAYDPAEGVLTWRVTMNGRALAGNVAGSMTAHGYRSIGVEGRWYPAHRLAWLIVHGEWPPQEIDHINGQRNDNRLENLRAVSKRGNGQNMQCHREGHLPGTTYDRNLGRWKASCKVSGRRVHIGLFDSAEEAHEAYMKRVRLIDGERAAA